MRCEEEREEEDHETTTNVHRFTKHDLKKYKNSSNKQTAKLTNCRHTRTETPGDHRNNNERKTRRERSITHTEQKERS